MEEAKEYKKYLKGLKKATQSSSKKDFEVKKIKVPIEGVLLRRTGAGKKSGGRIELKGGGGKPTNVKTFVKRTKAMGGGFMAKRMAMR